MGAVLSSGWETASRLGAWAFLVVALIGQALAWIVFAAAHAVGNGTLGAVKTLQLGGFYFFGFHHVGITFSGDVPTGGFGSGPGGRFEFGFAVALLLVTWFAAFLLFQYGKRVAEEVGGGPWARVVHGAKVAVPYAVLSLLLSFLVPLHVAAGGSSGAPSVQVGVKHVGAFVIPFLLGLVAGGLGGLWSARAQVEARRFGRRGLGALTGGWRMFVYGLAFSFVSLLVMAAIKPGLTSTVIRGETGRKGGFGVSMVHHVLALPNQSMWVLVPAMGGCDGAYGGGAASVSLDFLCYGHFPRGDRTTQLSPGGRLFTTQVGGLPTLPLGFGTAPAVYFLFLLVPAATVLAGGARAGRGAGTQRDGATDGALAGVVFGALVGLGAWLAGVGITAGGGVFGFHVAVRGSIGPRIVSAVLFGLVWGIVGGAAGGAIAARRSVPPVSTLEPQHEGPAREAAGPS
jgi:hypothetical protein